MADEKKTPTGPTKITEKYQYAFPIDLNAQIACGRTGISKKVNQLTDEDIKKMVEAGNKNFTEIPKAEVKAK